MTANSADAQKLWGWLGADGADGGSGGLVKQAPNDAAPVVYGDFVFGETGGATNADLTGSTPLTFATSASLTGQGVLSGASSLTFTTAGTLIADGALSGASSLTFTASGVLDGAGGITNADLTGATTLTFTPSGSMAGGGVLTGQTPLTFTTSGGLSGNAVLAGASTITFTTSGTLNGAALIGGASFPTFTLSGNLTTGALLSGAANLNFTPTGTLTGYAVTVEDAQWIGDGVGKGRERADEDRLARERELRDIIAKSFDKVLGEPLTPASEPVTAKQRQTVARQTFRTVETEGMDASIREIERLVRRYETELLTANLNAVMRMEDEFMMVALLA